MRLFSGIQRKIVLTFSCVFLAVFAVTALLAAQVVMRLQENAVRKQSEDIARFISGDRLPLSRGLMERIKAVYGKEVAFYDANTKAVATTLGGVPESRFAELAAGTGHFSVSRAARNKSVVQYSVFSAPVGADGSRLCLMLPEEELKAASVAAARPVVAVAAAGAAITLVLGILLARTITQPLRALAAKADDVARTGNLAMGDLKPGTDEVANLAAAFQRMLARLEESRRKLLEAEKLAAVGRVATGIAHEIRNPLASMKMNAQILQEAARENELAGLIVKEIERIQLLIDELLYYSRPVPLRTQPESLNDLLDESLAAMAARLQHARVSVRRQYDAHLPPVKLDRERFKQVAINLILNAMQAMPGGGVLTVRTSTGNATATAEFDDTGCGVPDGADAQIFAPFFSTRQGGIGIGLAVSKRVVEAHGGQIQFQRKQQGTIFQVHIPV